MHAHTLQFLGCESTRMVWPPCMAFIATCEYASTIANAASGSDSLSQMISSPTFDPAWVASRVAEMVKLDNSRRTSYMQVLCQAAIVQFAPRPRLHGKQPGPSAMLADRKKTMRKATQIGREAAGKAAPKRKGFANRALVVKNRRVHKAAPSSSVSSSADAPEQKTWRDYKLPVTCEHCGGWWGPVNTRNEL